MLWFKNDLRLHDNYTVERVSRLVSSGSTQEVDALPVAPLGQHVKGVELVHSLNTTEESDRLMLWLQVVPLYCFDPRHFTATPWGNPKTGNFRAQFLLQSVLDLKQSLRKIGSDLIIRFGQPEIVIPGRITPSPENCDQIWIHADDYLIMRPVMSTAPAELLGDSEGKVITQEEFAYEELQTLAKVGRPRLAVKIQKSSILKVSEAFR